MNVRGMLYLIARLMGDYSAVRRGRVKERLINRGIGNVLARFFRQVMK